MDLFTVVKLQFLLVMKSHTIVVVIFVKNCNSVIMGDESFNRSA